MILIKVYHINNNTVLLTVDGGDSSDNILDSFDYDCFVPNEQYTLIVNDSIGNGFSRYVLYAYVGIY